VKQAQDKLGKKFDQFTLEEMKEVLAALKEQTA
jgi:hypothetical protein